MAFLHWLSGQVLPLFSDFSSRRRSRKRCVQTVGFESLEPRLVLSALEITPLLNGQASGGQSQPLIEVDKPLIHTWEIRNTGIESLTLSQVIDDGGNGFQETPFAISTFIPVSGRRDSVHDAKRGLLYITTDDGYVRRYDLVEDRFLTPFFVGGRPLSVDLSPNENQLIVTNRQGPWFHLIDLETSAIVRQNVPGTDSTFTAAFITDTEYVLSVGRSIQGLSVSLPETNSSPVLTVSADRTTVAYAGTGVSSGPVGRFQRGGSGWQTAETMVFNSEVAVSRNGQQVAAPTGFGTYIYDANLQQVGQIGIVATEVPIGAVYSPVSDKIYFAWAEDYDRDHASIDAWDTRTLQRTAIIDPAWQFSWTGNMSFENGRLKISRDGQILISTVTGGIRTYGTDDLTARFVSGDVNSNGLMDPDEVWTYTARDVSKRGFRQNTVRVTAESATGQFTETLAAGYRGVTYNIDYGDAPDPRYPTSFASGGASHSIASGLALGAKVDHDLDAQPSLLANADDLTGNDDDDGVTFATPLVPGTTTTIDVRVTSSGPVVLNAWIDFNGDGDWSDTGEHFAKDTTVSPGLNSISVSVPVWAIPGTTFSRFRLSKTGGLEVTGRAANGEVEDHALSISPVVPVPEWIPSIVAPSVLFSWRASPYADAYEVQVSTRGTTPVSSTRKTTTNLNWQPETPLGIGRYAFWVRALNGDNNPSAWSPMQEFSVDASPVIDVPFTSTFDRTPELRWSAVPGAATYDIYIQSLKTPAPSLYALIRNVSGSSWSSSSALAIGSYRFWVRAVNRTAETSSWSANPVTLTVGGQPKLATPPGTLSIDGPLEWLPVDGAARYELWIDQAGGTRKLVWDDKITQTSFQPTFALPKGTYSVWLQAITESGERSPWSDRLTVSMTQDRPFMSASRSTFDTTPTWKWNAISDVTAYDLLIQKIESGVVKEEIVHSGLSQTEYTPSESMTTGTYRAYFRGVRNEIAGSWQSPPAETRIGGSPQQLSVDRTLPEAPMFSWQPIEGAASYEIWISKTGSSSPFLRLQGLADTTLRSDSAWPKGEYTAWVRAMNAAGKWSPWSLPVLAKVVIERPFLSGVNPTFDRTPEFVWPAIAGATTYDLRLERQASSGYEEVALYRGLTQTRFTQAEDLPDGNYRLTFRRNTADDVPGPWQSPAAGFHVGGKTSIRAVSVDENKLLRVVWRPVDGAAKSDLWISEVGGSGRVIQKTIDAASEFRFDTPLSAGTFRIWIRSISPTGLIAPWSEPTTFKVI